MQPEAIIPLVVSLLTAIGLLYKTYNDAKTEREKAEVLQRQTHATAWQAGMEASTSSWAALCEKMQSRIDQLTRRIERYEERIDHLEKELREASDKIDQLERERDEANARIKVLEEERNKVIGERDSLRLEVGKLKSKTRQGE